MKAFILAAGKGERLKPITEHIPKPLLPIQGIPNINYQLALARIAGIEELIINIHHLGDLIKDYFARHSDFGFDIYFSEEEELLGTGGALKKCSHLLHQPFILMNADIISNFDIRKLIKAEKTSLVLSESSNDNKFSVAYYDERVKDFSGLAGTGYIDNYQYIGAAKIMPEMVDYLPSGASHLVTSGYIPLVKKGELSAITHSGWWFDTGTFERRKMAEDFIKNNSVDFRFAELGLLPEKRVLQALYKNIMEV